MTEPRPTLLAPAVIDLACRSILPDVMRWLEDGDEVDVFDQLRKSHSFDGYEFARNLEQSFGWGADAGLVEILDNCSTFFAHEKVVKEWVSRNNITVPHKIGELVIARGTQCKVVDIRNGTGQVVCQPLNEDCEKYGDKGGWVINFEDLSVVPALTAP